MNKTENNTKKEQTLVFKGVVLKELPAMEYEVKIDFKGIEHRLCCYVSGKMKKNFIQIKEEDEVEVELSVYNIDKGRIIKRITPRKPIQPEAA